MTSHKHLGIIIPSFNDIRITEAISSVRRFDDIDAVRLIVIDGGSRSEVRDAILPLLRDGDIFVHEHDRGIFDALNKGLDLCDTEFVGWLGSDDLFSGQVPASAVIQALAQNDLFIADLAVFRGSRIQRRTHSRPSALGLVRFGLHNPHYSTFGRARLLQSERFGLELMASDIDYFIKIFERKPRIICTSRVATLQGAGGFSNTSYRRILRINWQLLGVYAAATHPLFAPFALLTKLGNKCCSRLYYMLFKLDRHELEV